MNEAINYEILAKCWAIGCLLADDRVTDIFEWMAYCLDLADWQLDDGSVDEIGLAEFADENFAATWATKALCEGAAVLYGFWVYFVCAREHEAVLA